MLDALFSFSMFLAASAPITAYFVLVYAAVCGLSRAGATLRGLPVPGRIAPNDCWWLRKDVKDECGMELISSCDKLLIWR